MKSLHELMIEYLGIKTNEFAKFLLFVKNNQSLTFDEFVEEARKLESPLPPSSEMDD